MLQALPEKRRGDIAALMRDAMKQLARDDNTLWFLLLKKSKKDRQKFLFNKIKSHLKAMDAGGEAAMILDDRKYYSMEWDAPGGSVTVDIRARHETKVIFSMSKETADYWVWDDRRFRRRFTKAAGRYEYTYTIPAHMNVELVLKEIEQLFAVRPHRLDFGDEPAH